MNSFFLNRDGAQFGPYDEDESRGYYASGHIAPTDLVWCEGWPEWRDAAAVFGAAPPASALAATASPTVATAAPIPGLGAAPNAATVKELTGKRQADHLNAAGEGIETWKGFSWPCLFFGPLWFLYKGMGLWSLGALGLQFLTLGIAQFVLPFYANALHTKWLVKQGYRRTSGVSTDALKRPTQGSWAKRVMVAAAVFLGSIIVLAGWNNSETSQLTQIPSRLSCSKGVLPSTWDDGQLVMDFTDNNRMLMVMRGESVITLFKWQISGAGYKAWPQGKARADGSLVGAADRETPMMVEFAGAAGKTGEGDPLYNVKLHLTTSSGQEVVTDWGCVGAGDMRKAEMVSPQTAVAEAPPPVRQVARPETAEDRINAYADRIASAGGAMCPSIANMLRTYNRNFGAAHATVGELLGTAEQFGCL